MLDEDLINKKKDPDNDPVLRAMRIIRAFCLMGGLAGILMILVFDEEKLARLVIFASLILYALALGAEIVYKRMNR